ncbi:hypothetical protein BGX21_009227 [Mortierella sp. AD011]|nr:hypothetical protein BGX20_009786 [Mortierella sp. AD010]KAF9403861.1 hypothetical protein BGX21_009227 [Mortierella sp. AD011]
MVTTPLMKMDSDWCLFCEKHVQDLGAVYCSKECAKKDILMATSASLPSDPSFSIVSNLAAFSSTSGPTLSFRRSSCQTVPVIYPCMFRSSSPGFDSGLDSASDSSSIYRGINKHFSPASAMTVTSGVRCLSLNRGATPHPLVLQDQRREK